MFSGGGNCLWRMLVYMLECVCAYIYDCIRSWLINDAVGMMKNSRLCICMNVFVDNILLKNMIL